VGVTYNLQGSFSPVYLKRKKQNQETFYNLYFDDVMIYLQCMKVLSLAYLQS